MTQEKEAKGTCKHGEFVLRDGCPQCIQEERERRELEAEGETVLLESAEAEAREQATMERLTGVGEEEPDPEELTPEEELEQAPFLKQVEEDIG